MAETSCGTIRKKTGRRLVDPELLPPKRELRQVGHQGQPYQHNKEEGKGGAKQTQHGFPEALAGEKKIDANRRGQITYLEIGEEDDAEMHRIDAETLRQRQNQRHDDHDGGKDVHDAPDDQKKGIQEQQELQLALHVLLEY